jgi:uncharacterized cupredoxin-like copper-binding protein
MIRSLAARAAIALSCAWTGACAGPAAPSTITVTLSEFAFEMPETTLEEGVPYRFVLVNEGSVPHEWAVVPRGDRNEDRLLVEVSEEDLPAGATAVKEFTFPRAGEYDFACFLPGHYEDGMVLPIRVVDRR